MTRNELVQTIIDLSGSDANENGFYEELAVATKDKLIEMLVNLAVYYKNECDN